MITDHVSPKLTTDSTMVRWTLCPFYTDFKLLSGSLFDQDLESKIWNQDWNQNLFVFCLIQSPLLLQSFHPPVRPNVNTPPVARHLPSSLHSSDRRALGEVDELPSPAAPGERRKTWVMRHTEKWQASWRSLPRISPWSHSVFRRQRCRKRRDWIFTPVLSTQKRSSNWDTYWEHSSLHIDFIDSASGVHLSSFRSWITIADC